MQVKNAGNARVPGATLYIRWPYETSAGQHILYLLHPPTIVSNLLGLDDDDDDDDGNDDDDA